MTIFALKQQILIGSLSLSKQKGPQAQTDVSEFHWFGLLFKFQFTAGWTRFIILYHH